MAASTFMYYFTFGSCASKGSSASSNNENPLGILHHGSLLFFSYLFLLSLLVLLSSTAYITTAFVTASKHLRLEIKILCYCTLHSTVQYPKAQPLVEDAHK